MECLADVPKPISSPSRAVQNHCLHRDLPHSMFGQQGLVWLGLRLGCSSPRRFCTRLPPQGSPFGSTFGGYNSTTPWSRLYSLAPARLALRVHLRWLQLDPPKVSFQRLGSPLTALCFATASPDAFVPFGTVPAIAGQATPCHQALGVRKAVPPCRVPVRGLLRAWPLGFGSPPWRLLRSPISFDSLAPALGSPQRVPLMWNLPKPFPRQCVRQSL